MALKRRFYFVTIHVVLHQEPEDGTVDYAMQIQLAILVIFYGNAYLKGG